MTGLAIALVLGAALIHASWNYLLKKSGGGIGFVWAFAALSSLLYAALAVGGAFFLAASPAKLREAGASRGIAFALLTGCMIASYTVVDKQAVSAVLIPPLLQDWGANLGRVIVMAPLALRRRGEVKAA